MSEELHIVFDGPRSTGRNGMTKDEIEWSAGFTAGREAGLIEAERETVERIAALIAAGDKLAGYAECSDWCDWADHEGCECGHFQAQRAWREARDA